MSDQKPSRSFVSRLGAEQICKVRGKDNTGRQAWYYVLIPASKLATFERRSRQGQVVLTDYGTILFSGYGDDAPPDIVKRMKDDFGFEE